MILTNGRSGSNYLVDIINQHPLLMNYGEVLGTWSNKRKIKTLLMLKSEEEYLDFILQNRFFFYMSQLFYYFKDRKSFHFKKRKNIERVGVKDFGINIQRYQLQDWLKSKSEFKVIHLYRQNQLDRYISLFAMKSTGLVSTKMGSTNSKMTVDCENLINTLEVYEEEMAFQIELANSLDPERVISISYEELFMSEHKSEIISSIFNFLGVNDIEIKDRHKRILSKELSEKVENYSELVTVIEATKFKKYLR